MKMMSAMSDVMGGAGGMSGGVCPECGNGRVEGVCVGGAVIYPICGGCEERRAGLVLERNCPKERFKRHFLARVEGCYRKALMGQIPREIRACMEWDGVRYAGGMGIFGDAGGGKTMALVCVLWRRKEFFEWVDGARLREISLKASSGATSAERVEFGGAWDGMFRAGVLMIDDFGQPIFTEAYAAKMFELLEYRLKHGKPTFWTMQHDPAGLREKIARQSRDEAVADAIVRRLTQHSLVLRVGRIWEPVEKLDEVEGGAQG